jgi:hypothetical protein
LYDSNYIDDDIYIKSFTFRKPFNTHFADNDSFLNFDIDYNQSRRLQNHGFYIEIRQIRILFKYLQSLLLIPL